MARNILSQYLVTQGLVPSSSGAAALTSLFDMSGYRSIVAILQTTVSATSHNIHAEGCTAASTTGGTAAVDLTGSQVDGAGGDGNIALEITDPTFRYIRFQTAATTAVLSSLLILQGPADTQAVTQTADAEIHAALTSGTA